MHRQIVCQLLRATLDGYQGGDARAVQVGAQVIRRAQAGEAAHADVLADLGHQLAAAQVDTLSSAKFRLGQGGKVRRL